MEFIQFSNLQFFLDHNVQYDKCVLATTTRCAHREIVYFIV